jgi:RiboL-PSP-HEPN
MKQSREMFKAGNWYQEILVSLNFYQIVHAFLTDKEALKKHLDSLQVITASDEGVTYRGLETAPEFASHIESTVERGEQFHNRQMVVVASTYIELILRDYLIVLFNHFPLRMYEYLYAQDKDELGGFVSLKEVVQVDSLNDLLKNLSEQATANALKGRFTAQVNNLERITSEKIPDDLKRKLTRLIEMRNRIVHETSPEEISEAQVKGVLDSCHELINFLAWESNKESIPLDEYSLFNL